MRLITPDQDMQAIITRFSELGENSFQLSRGTFNLSANLVIPSNVNITGAGSGDNGTIIDFGGGAYQIQCIGTNVYTDGTVTINTGDTTVIGTDTVWTPDMIGRRIFLSTPFGLSWYIISDVTDETTFTIDTPFRGDNLVDSTYVICNPNTSVLLQSFTVQNSSTDLIKIQYANSPLMNDITAFNGGGAGIVADTIVNYLSDNFTIDTCVKGHYVSNTYPLTITTPISSNITGGNGYDFNNCINFTFQNFSADTIVGIGANLVNSSNLALTDFSVNATTEDGIAFDNTPNASIIDFSISNTGGNGITLTGSLVGNQITEGLIDTIGGNGIDLSDGVETAILTTMQIINCTGYGVNVDDNMCVDNILCDCVLRDNGTNVNDSGTDTLIRSNIGINDN